jgi:hypothetical protein
VPNLSDIRQLRSRFETAPRKVRSHDTTILLGYVALAIVLLIANLGFMLS